MMTDEQIGKQPNELQKKKMTDKTPQRNLQTRSECLEKKFSGMIYV